MEDKQWVVYILECKDATLYTGITDNFAKRFRVHIEGKGAKYTRGRGPLQLRYLECCRDKSHALRREIEIKRLSRHEKLDLCNRYAATENNAPR